MNIETVTAEQVMSRVLVTITPEESPLMAWELMRRAGVHHLPVIDAQARPLGILTRQDLADNWSGGPAEQSRRQVHSLLGRVRTPHARPGHSLAEAAAAMLDASCDAIPVVREDGRLIGMITTVDVLAAVAGRTVVGEGAGELRTALFRIEPVPLPTGERS
ncbi:HPP family protein [Planomonospora sp. ID82291]|uniref:CBS domain-containing protein n=1 Tax=Planomonospora sp. ID82291 TaxID=2738136 RepID=UPI0018C402E4|nr:CBS domain-containing protein [Planomonospora sp. ID82291]MBG0817832.1 CBS domain-containing protein [Planomonospora sp. ID82291]